jgi:hypothetical protein
MGFGIDIYRIDTTTLSVKVEGEGVSRDIVLRVGRTYVVEPPNKAKLQNRGRRCTLVKIDDDPLGGVDEAGCSMANTVYKVVVRYVDTGRRGRVPPQDLVDVK